MVGAGLRLGEDGRERVRKKSCLRSNELCKVATMRTGGGATDFLAARKRRNKGKKIKKKNFPPSSSLRISEHSPKNHWRALRYYAPTVYH